MTTVLTNSRNQALANYFRCPEDMGDCVPSGTLSSESGYFKFGPEIICFGQSSSGVSAQVEKAGLHDALQNVSVEDSMVHLPFDPAQVIENLRRERYAVNIPRPSAIRSAYYVVRPLLPVYVRRHLQRFRLRDWGDIPFPSWPVDRTVENLMERLLFFSLKAHAVDRMPFIWFWPEGSPGCVIMTHDVEELAGRDFCSKLMDINDTAGVKASFQIVPERRYPVSEGFLNDIRQRGFEINVHDLNHDGNLYRERQTFLLRAERI